MDPSGVARQQNEEASERRRYDRRVRRPGRMTEEQRKGTVPTPGLSSPQMVRQLNELKKAASDTARERRAIEQGDLHLDDEASAILEGRCREGRRVYEQMIQEIKSVKWPSQDELRKAERIVTELEQHAKRLEVLEKTFRGDAAKEAETLNVSQNVVPDEQKPDQRPDSVVENDDCTDVHPVLPVMMPIAADKPWMVLRSKKDES